MLCTIIRQLGCRRPRSTGYEPVHQIGARGVCRACGRSRGSPTGARNPATDGFAFRPRLAGADQSTGTDCATGAAAFGGTGSRRNQHR